MRRGPAGTLEWSGGRRTAGYYWLGPGNTNGWALVHTGWVGGEYPVCTLPVPTRYTPPRTTQLPHPPWPPPCTACSSVLLAPATC